MSEMKMSDEMKSIQGVKVSDVFDLTKVSFPSSYTDNQVRVAGRAIANYDRMVEEIAELKGAIDGAINIGRLWLPSSYSVENREEDKAIYNMHSEFIRLLLRDDSDGSEQESKEKPNQEGEE